MSLRPPTRSFPLLVLVAGLQLGIAAAGEEKDVTIPQEGGAERQEFPEHLENSPSRFSDEPLAMNAEAIPRRPAPILEVGEKLLASGKLARGLRLPTGAVWRPSLVVFGNFRTALQSFDDGDTRVSEWASRLDLFFGLQFSGTERLLLGVRPLDKDGQSVRRVFEPNSMAGWDDRALNADVTSLFFEGELGEIFPTLDRNDRRALDIGFSVGRQPLLIQDGILINDRIDAVAVTRNTLRPAGASNLRLTALWGWNEVGRGDNLEDRSADLFGLFLELDTMKATWNLDASMVDSREETGDALFLAVSRVSSFGRLNATLRAAASLPQDRETAATGRGTLLFSELSTNLGHTEHLIYLNGFRAIDDFSSVARDVDVGGPLERAGILFEARGVGSFGSALSSDASRAMGGSLGAQFFAREGRRQFILELGGRAGTDPTVEDEWAIGGRFQQAFGRRHIMQLDTYFSTHDVRRDGVGGRVEWQVKF